MNKIALDPYSEAYRLLNPGCVVLVSVGDGARDNIFTVTWNMPVRKSPGMVAILSGKGHFSYPFMAGTGEFGLNIPSEAIANAVLGCGKISGKSGVDKFEQFNLTRQAPTHIKAPLVAEAVGNIECRICQIVDLGTSSIVIAQILAAKAATDHFKNGNWSFENGLTLLHHMSGNKFCVTDRALIVEQTEVKP